MIFKDFYHVCNSNVIIQAWIAINEDKYCSYGVGALEIVNTID